LENEELSNTPILMAYRAAAEMTLANCVFNPWKKYAYFKNGKKDLDNAVIQKPDDIEIRYIRFLVQSYLPRILNYNNIEEDKEFIIESLILERQTSVLDANLTFLTEQMILSEKVTTEEKSKLKILLSSN
jgi:hypothetical protein